MNLENKEFYNIERNYSQTNKINNEKLLYFIKDIAIFLC